MESNLCVSRALEWGAVYYVLKYPLGWNHHWESNDKHLIMPKWQPFSTLPACTQHRRSEQNWYSYSWMRRMRLLPLALSICSYVHIQVLWQYLLLRKTPNHRAGSLIWVSTMEGSTSPRVPLPCKSLLKAKLRHIPSPVFHLSSILFIKYLDLVSVSCPTCCHGPCFWGSCGSMFRICPQKAASYFSF